MLLEYFWKYQTQIPATSLGHKRRSYTNIEVGLLVGQVAKVCWVSERFVLVQCLLPLSFQQRDKVTCRY